MLTRTDNAADAGKHIFERAGLGKAPFRCVGSFELKWQACPGAPIQPGGSCDYCSQGIMYAYAIKSADGRRFKVGCDCVMRTGDAGLIKSYKNRPEVRQRNRDKAAARDERIKAEWAALMADDAARAKLEAHTIPDWNGTGKRSWLGFALKSWSYSGAAGRARNLKEAKKILAGKV